MKKKITIITSTYNTKSEYLSELWESIKAQSSQEWQWIIRDDGSITDVIDAIDLADDRVHYISGSNVGRGASMAILMQQPQLTEWVLHVDADDWLDLKAVEYVLAAAQKNPDCALIYADSWSHRLDRLDDGFQLPEISEDLLHGSRLFHLIVMNVAAYRKTEGYNSGFRWSSDYDVWLKLQEIGPFHHLSVQLYHWREHIDQMFHSYQDEQIFFAYKAVKAACMRRNLKITPRLVWHLNAIR
jgi:O-antigen biosynthesis protein